MKYYSRQFSESESFYEKFFLPDVNLEQYALRENILRRLGTHEDAIEILNNEYLTHCKEHYKEGILFYDELTKYIVDEKGDFKTLDEYILLKLRYYATKVLDILNEGRNFFYEERKKFKENNYPKAIVTLSECMFHDTYAIFEYNDTILRITFFTDHYKKIFEFYGVKNWKEQEFMKKSPCLVDEEVYEESVGLFIYNTLWVCGDIIGEQYPELSIKFTDLAQIQ